MTEAKGFEWIEADVADTRPLTICNNGADIVETNYWDSEAAKKGFCYLSGNAGALRLLVPESIAKEYLPEMRTGMRVSIETSIASPFCIDVVFDDGSESPFFIALDRTLTSRMPDSARRDVPFAVWPPGGKILSLRATVEALPPYPVICIPCVHIG